MANDVEQRERRIGTMKAIVAALLAAALGAFIAQNTEEEELEWLMLSFSAPLWVMLAIVMVIAFLIGILVGRPGRRANRR